MRNEGHDAGKGRGERGSKDWTGGSKD